LKVAVAVFLSGGESFAFGVGGTRSIWLVLVCSGGRLAAVAFGGGVSLIEIIEISQFSVSDPFMLFIFIFTGCAPEPERS
jgi:hypothetical protein